MIHTSRIITVGKEESTLNDPIILYRGDRQVEVEFEIIGSDYTYTNGDNVIKTTNATHGQLVLNTPTGNSMFSDVTNCEDGKVIFIITGEMIDELEEVGFYSFQIRLFDESQGSRVTLPPIYKGVDIRNPIASEDQNSFVGSAMVDYAEIQNDNNQEIPTFDAFGNYNKTEWINRDVITSNKLNKIENALYEVNNTTNKSKIELDLKVDKDHIWSMSNMGQDIKEAMTGGSVAVVGINSISTDNIRDKQITGRKISDGSISESKLRESGKLYNVMGEIDFEFSNQYISTNGTLNPMEGWYVSYPISMECMPIEVIVDSSSYIPGIWVDDSYRYTEDISKKIVDNYDGTYSITFNYPTSSASKYLRINHNDSNISSIRFSSNGCINTKHLKDGIITREKLSKDFKITNDIISNDSITGDKLVKAGSIIDMTHYPIEHIGYYIDDLGRLTALQDWKVTCPIDITNTSYIIYKSSQTPALLGCFFDDNDSYITGVKYWTEDENGIYITTINVIDKNNKYINLKI